DFNKRSLAITADGSHTVVLTDEAIHYHSIHGAIQESKHVFLRMGWEALPSSKHEVRILEIGFGTGLNALLQFELGQQTTRPVHYTALEAYPLELELALACNYVSTENAYTQRTVFEQMHRCAWNESIQLSEHFVLEKIHTTLENYQPKSQSIDLIYFDAFAPNFQPELWTIEIFSKLYQALATGGLLVTYCAKGEVRRNLQAAGFSVERLDGPPGKREMLRGKKV
ncbi:MAG: tRNA (5-methylaminomethyl-2-thiouridine)(34)-methyltransferase MnmD, partial [Bacteroidia bacterium]